MNNGDDLLLLFSAGHHGHGQLESGVSEPKVAVEPVAGSSGEHGHEQLHAYIGVSLVLGFVFMLLVDQIGTSHLHSSSSSDGKFDQHYL